MEYLNKLKQYNYHFTYGGSIMASIMIWFFSFFFNNCGSISHQIMHKLMLLKCFFLYDSTLLIYLHHIIQFIVIYNLPINNQMICSAARKEMFDSGYSIMITPVFQNIKIYMKPKSNLIKLSLDTMTGLSFLYVRGKFNYYYLFGEGINEITKYVIEHTSSDYVFITLCGMHSSLFIICLMNIYWGHKIIKKILVKTNILKYLHMKKYN